MGLRDYRIYQKKKLVIEALKEYGITEDDLKYIPKALEKVKGMNINKPVSLSDEEKKKIMEEQAQKLTPEQIIQAFTGQGEEFYPNGKPKE